MASATLFFGAIAARNGSGHTSRVMPSDAEPSSSGSSESFPKPRFASVENVNLWRTALPVQMRLVRSVPTEQHVSYCDSAGTRATLSASLHHFWSRTDG